MDFTIFLWPLGWLLLSLVFFFLSLRQESRQLRVALAVLHLCAATVSFSTDSEVLGRLPQFVVPFTIGVTVHTTSILFLDMSTTTAGLSFFAQLKATALIWCNIRRLKPCRLGPTTTTANHKLENKGRAWFGLARISRALALYLVDRVISEILLTRTLGSLSLGLHSFAPAKQVYFPGLWAAAPRFTRSDLILRAITCTHWIWSTYYSLTALHNVCAALFVSALAWDSPDDWTSRPLFGSVWDAYTLRRFWGVFWQRLHVRPFLAYTPHPRLPKALQALWVFLLSAGCHALANWMLRRRANALSELRFFGLNWAMCLSETALGLDDGKVITKSDSMAASISRRIIGFVLVWGFFFCTVPAWQYPLVYSHHQ